MSPMSQHTLTRTDVSVPFLFQKAFSSIQPPPQSTAEGSLSPRPHELVQHWRRAVLCWKRSTCTGRIARKPISGKQALFSSIFMLSSDPPRITIDSIGTSCICILFIGIPAGRPWDGGLSRLQQHAFSLSESMPWLTLEPPHVHVHKNLHPLPTPVTGMSPTDLNKSQATF